MPLYEYECEKCNQVTEVLQKMSDKPLKDCPVCKAKKSLKKLLSAGSFRFRMYR